MEIGCSRTSDITPVKITEHPVSSPDESPMQRNSGDAFFDLLIFWAHG
jgi:hypothetical protein